MGLNDIFVDFGGERAQSTDSRQLGIARGTVTEVIDSLMSGRVRVSIPSMPDIEPWAPVCAPFAGDGYGMWCMPQVGDTVIVAFEHGDPTWPVVIGSVWNGPGEPPIDQPLDAKFKRVLKTPNGHSLVFDDLEQSITLSHVVGHAIEITADGISIQLAGGAGKLELTLPGEAKLSGAVSAELGAPRATVAGDVTLDLKAATTTVSADATLRVSGGLVTIN